MQHGLIIGADSVCCARSMSMGLQRSEETCYALTDDVLCQGRAKWLTVQTGHLELVRKAQLPTAARKISATFCPKLHASEPEHLVSGAEDMNVYVYDVSLPYKQPVVVNKLEVRVLATLLLMALHLA